MEDRTSTGDTGALGSEKSSEFTQRAQSSREHRVQRGMRQCLTYITVITFITRIKDPDLHGVHGGTGFGEAEITTRIRHCQPPAALPFWPGHGLDLRRSSFSWINAV